jgi:hypothetical protein
MLTQRVPDVKFILLINLPVAKIDSILRRMGKFELCREIGILGKRGFDMVFLRGRVKLLDFN